LSIKVVVRPFTVLLFLSLYSLLSVAQQTPPPANPSASASQQSSPDQTKTDQTKSDQTTLDQTKDNTNKTDQANDKNAQTGNQQGKNAGTSNDRLFFTLPNFLTMENSGKLPPLTVKEKFKVVARGSFDYVQYPWYGFLAGLSQAEDSEPGYGQGAQGYAKRYGAAFADGTIENFMTGAVLPSVLHQDPRFYQLGHGGFWHRVFYAASRNLITLSDSGHTQFNYSEVAGGAIAAAISTYSYHPEADRTISNTASVWGTQYGYDTLTLVIKEFWPDIRRKVHKQKTQTPPAENPAH
jgi:hypothetical protein